MEHEWLVSFVNSTPRYLDRFVRLLQRDVPHECGDLETEWLRGQCDFRGLDSSGASKQLKARLVSLPGGNERELLFRSLHLEAQHHLWDEDTFNNKLKRVMEGLEDPKAALAVKVRPGNRIAALRATSAINLAHKSLTPPCQFYDQCRWVIVGADPIRVREKAAEIIHRFTFDMLRRGGVDQARAKLRQEEAINTGESELKQRNAKRPRTEISNYQGVLNDIPGASLEELRNIKQRYLMYSGEVLDPDVDVWIPDNPSSSCLGLTRSTISERRKSYWEAQCYFRGLPTQGHLIILQGRLRDRAEVVERSIAEKIDMCERVLDAEWLLEHPRTRFNVRAVRKARKIMLYPEENAIARGWLSSRDIRPATLARLRPRQASFAESDGGT